MLVNEKHSFRRESRLSSRPLSFITVISALVEAAILLITIVEIICHCRCDFFPNLRESEDPRVQNQCFYRDKDLFSNKRISLSNPEFHFHRRRSERKSELPLK